ncbi:MAG: antibiotic biosynthesis monooxygenase [Deltaproteobacteria bacterium HGW-Deltaproteobacteria-21]|nr:MAG: antibiotic biosynthesis monooxygenase [Deltaproteobacteria bacterium HGW-Deltaproteobacteria-21]
MISRHWKGVARDEMAHSYIDHLKRETFPKLSEIKGFVRSSILVRKVEQGMEFLIITEWESMESIRAFAGEPADTAVVPPVVHEMMVDYDRKVIHYEINAEFKGLYEIHQR